MEFRLLSPEVTVSSRAEDYEVGEEENLELPSSPLFEPVAESGVDFLNTTFDIVVVGVYGAGSQFIRGAFVERKDELGLINVASIRSQDEAHHQKKLKRSKEEIVDHLYLYSNHGMKILIIDSGSVIEQRHNAQYNTVKENHQQAYTTYLYAQLLVETIKAKRFVILDSILASSYIVSDRRLLHTPLLRCIRSESDKQLYKSISLPPYLESPNLITGLAASIFSLLENRGQPAILLCSLEENHALEQVTMKAFEPSVFGLLVPSDQSSDSIPVSPLSPSSALKYKTLKASVEHQSLYL